MIQIFNSVAESIKDRTRNPFFATLISVWLVRNWELVYTLFNFDKDCTLIDKTNFIRDYYHPKSFWEELIINISISMGLMILAYCLIIITRVIVNIVEHRITPYLNDKTVSGLAVKRTLYEQVKKERLELQNDLDIAYKKLVETEVSNSKYRSENSGFRNEKIKNENEIKTLEREVNDLEKTKDELITQVNTLDKHLTKSTNINEELQDKIVLRDFLNHENFQSAKNTELPRIIHTYKQLQEDKNLTEFIVLAECIIDEDKTTSIPEEKVELYIRMVLLKDTDDDISMAIRNIKYYSSEVLELTPHGYSLYANRKFIEEVMNT